MLSVIEDKRAPKERRDRMALSLARHLKVPETRAESDVIATAAKLTGRKRPARKAARKGKKLQAAQASSRVAQHDSKWSGLVRTIGAVQDEAGA